MQRKKKVAVKKSADIASPRASARQRKVSENRHPEAKEAQDLITSSVRKQILSSARSVLKNKECLPATDLNATFETVKNDTTTMCSVRDVTSECNSDSANIKGFDDNLVHEVVGTMFSPAYRISRTLGGEIAKGDFHHEDRPCRDGFTDTRQLDVLSENAIDIEERDFTEDTNVAWKGAGGDMSDISAVYFSMKNSKLECVDEYEQDHLSADGCVDEEELEELEFDPYFFMKTLPDLSSVVPAFRPVLLPKQTRSCPSTTLVLDLDETLVHSTLEPCDDADFTFTVDFNMKDHTVFVRARPHLRAFMDRVHSLFEVIIFTASQGIYAEQLLNVLDPKRKVFRHRVFRESCVFVNGNYLKDLTVLGRDLAHVIIIDNSPQAFGFQIDNGIPIESWFDDRSDRELLSLLPFLESLASVEDVRPLIADKFNLRQKIEAAYSPFRPTRRDPFAR